MPCPQCRTWPDARCLIRLAACFSYLYPPTGAGNAVIGLLRRVAAVTGTGNLVILVTRSRDRPFHHWPLELDRIGLWLQMDVVATGGPSAAAIINPLTGPATRMAFAIATLYCRRTDRHSEHRSAPKFDAYGLFRLGRRFRFCNAGYRIGRL